MVNEARVSRSSTSSGDKTMLDWGASHTFALHVADICNLAVFPNHLVAIHRLELHRLPERVLLTQLLPLSFFGGEALNDCVCSDVFGLRWIQFTILCE